MAARSLLNQQEMYLHQDLGFEATKPWSTSKAVQASLGICLS
jgi:hypothetical protein